MMLRNTLIWLVFTLSFPTAAAPIPTPPPHNTLDKQHDRTRQTLQAWAHSLDKWFGQPDPHQPASATLRLMLDTQWDKYNGMKIKPRVRGRVKLPVLERKMSVVFGDDELDHETLPPYPSSPSGHKHFDKTRARQDNSSLALRLSPLNQNGGIDTDIDIGVRSGDDLYLRLKAGKTWVIPHQHTITLEQMYRYGLDSKHFARTGFEVKKTQPSDAFIANYLHADYQHQHDQHGWSWGNRLYRQHHFAGLKRLNYGIQASGALSGQKKHRLNQYGVFTGWRQPIWRDWLFVQTEGHYANHRDENRKHHPSLLLRLEALF